MTHIRVAIGRAFAATSRSAPVEVRRPVDASRVSRSVWFCQMSSDKHDNREITGEQSFANGTNRARGTR